MAYQVADASGLIFMDSGLMYRAVAFGFQKYGLKSTESAVESFLVNLQLKVTCDQSGMRIYVDEEDMSSMLHTSRVTELSSRIAKLRQVRDFLLRIQHGFGQRFGRAPGVVAVGRDMGTVVFPDAELKFFVTASPQVRAHRRLEELRKKGVQSSFEEVCDAIVERDRQDSERAIAPLKKAVDAIEINTDHLTPDQQAAIILRYIRER